MADTKDTGGAAFPGQRLGADGKPECEESTGMTLRDYFAAAALTGLWACPHEMTDDDTGERIPTPISSKRMAEEAYKQADAMLLARKS